MYIIGEKMKIEQFFFEHPVFRHEEFAHWKATYGHMQAHSLNSALQYYAKTGRIVSIRRKLYAVIPPNVSAEDLIVDPYLVAGNATQDAVLGYHTALELMGASYSTFGQFTYISEEKSKPFEYQDRWYQSASLPIALQREQKPFINIEVINRQGVNLRITSAERTFVDILDRIELCGGWEEVCRSINNLAVLDISKIIEYCLLLENACLSAKVGYFLSQRQGAFAVSERELKPLFDTKPKTPRYVAKLGREAFRFIKQWNIFLPVSVVQHSWDEPYANI